MRKIREEFDHWSDEHLINTCLHCMGWGDDYRKTDSACRRDECPVRSERITRELDCKPVRDFTDEELDLYCDVLCSGSGCYDCMIIHERRNRSRHESEDGGIDHGIWKGGGISQPSYMSDEEWAEYKMTPGYAAEISRCDPQDPYDDDWDEW